MFKTSEQRFFSKIDQSKACWNWTSYKNQYGYGILKFNKNTWLAHRFSYEIHYGEIPPKMLVMHICDNRKCVNPDHLKVGTYLDNNLDTKNKGRNKKRMVIKGKVFCKNGHDVTASDSLYYYSNGYSGCKLCKKLININKTI